MIWQVIFARVILLAFPVVDGGTDNSKNSVDRRNEGKSNGTELVREANQDYPPPPAEFQDLVKRGAVNFVFYDPKRSPPQEFPAVTKFELRYQYRSENPTSFAIREGKRFMLVKPRFRTITLKVVHRVEVSSLYQTNDFWNSPLIRHEMDHVRISADPSWIDRFRAAIESIADISVPVSGEVSARQAAKLARDAVDEAVNEAVAKITQLLDIRYIELDRITKHGRLPLPAEFWDR